MSELKIETGESSCESNDSSEVIPGYTSVEQFTKDGFKTLMEAIRHSNALPTGRDWNFYNISDSFTKIINTEGSNVLRLMNQIMRSNEVESNIKNKILDEKTELVVEANDVILEKVANNIDEMNGIRKNILEPVIIQTVSAELPINGSWNRTNATTITINPTSPQTRGKNCIKLITAKNIVRPQKFFKDKIDNTNKYPWCPRITDKPNSLKPLAIFLEESENGEEYSHPYEFELDRFVPRPEQLLEEMPVFPREIANTPLVEIDQSEQLDELVETLRSCKEFAVDLEHHSYRSFMGFTCLLQISTKDTDYLIDTLALRDKLCILNEVFTNNKIVKIFHGADRDIEWLQRDLSIYVVNMFDTHQAAKILQYPALSLAFLMKKFCNVLPNKQFQLADWRIRPLPEEFKMYAREDTHYLIYIYKMLKKELLLKGNKCDNFLKSVIERSTELCKKRYLKPILRDDSHLDLYRKCKKMFDNRQLYALKEIYAWRDNLAREEDESLAYVLPNHMLLQISETLPREMQGILACCNPIPPLVRSHLLEVHQIVLKARDQPLEKAILKEDTTSGRGVLKKVSKVNVDSPLHCPHDLSRTPEFRDDLPTLLDFEELKAENRRFLELNLSNEKACSYSIFDHLDGCDGFNERQTFKKLRGFAYFSPYERYKLVKPFVAEEEKAEQVKKEAEKVKEENHVQEEATDDRSNEERIASIRDHFLQLSRKFSAELEAKKQQEEADNPRTEVEQVSRKRKRNNCDEEGAMEDSVVHAPVAIINWNENNFNNNNKKKRGKKRKFNEIGSSVDQNEAQNSQAKQQTFKKWKNNQRQQQWQRQKKKNQFNQQHHHPQQNQNQQPPTQNQQLQNQNQQPQKQNRKQKLQNQNLRQQHNQNQQQQNQNQKPQKQNRKQKLQNQNLRQQHNQNQQQQNQNQRQQNQNQRQQNQNRFQRQQNQNRFQHPQNRNPRQQQHNQNPHQQQKNINKKGQGQDNTNFVPYDYSSVDFRQFQGGAGSATGAINIKSNFKAKNRKKMGNKGTKSSLFNMNKNLNTNRGKGKGSDR